MSVADEDGIGYGRPPKKHQFVPGQSGNPKGRPKGSRSLANLVEDELDKKVTVTVEGKHVRISKRQLTAHQLANGAAKGDPKAIMTIMRLQQGAAAFAAAGSESDRPATEITPQQYEEALEALLNTKLQEKPQ